MMRGSLIAVPWGLAAGTPALCLDFVHPLPSPDEAFRHIRAAVQGRPGMSVAWIRSAPWADEDFASVIDVGLAEFPTIFAAQPIRAPSWGFRDVTWFVDCSALLEKPTTPEEITAAVGALPGFPAAAELLVADPHVENILPGLLDVVALSCGGPRTYCELAVRPGQLQHAIAMVARSGSGWHVRALAPAFPYLKLFEVP